MGTGSSRRSSDSREVSRALSRDIHSNEGSQYCSPEEVDKEEEEDEEYFANTASCSSKSSLVPYRAGVSKHPASTNSGNRRHGNSVPCILQFTCGVYFVEEEEGAVTIDIMRLGNQEGRVSCRFYTEDGSGKDGERYEAKEGEVVLESGEVRKSIQVSIIDSRDWRATLEFKVHLCDSEGCDLGQYLKACRVKVIDNDTFPSSRYPEVAQGIDAIKTVGNLSLFWEYWKLTFYVNGIAWKTLASLLFDQMKNAYLYYKLRIMAYMLNVLFHRVYRDPEIIDDHTQQAFWIGLGYILPMFLLHGWDLVSLRLDINGHARTFLQTNIVRKYLNYDDDSRSEVGVTDVQLAVREDASELAQGYMAVLSLLKLVGKLFVMVYFTLLQNREALPYVIVMPLIMLVFGCLRNNTLNNASALPDELCGDMLATVSDISKNYPLVADYQQRPKINDMFAQKASAWRDSKLSPDSVRVNNDYFTQWLGPVFIGVYIMMQAHNVLTGALGRGTFIATLSVFSEISNSFGEGYQQFMKINSIAGTLQDMTEMLNRPTDLKPLKKVNRQRREATKAARDAILQQEHGHLFPTDLIKLELKDVSFRYGGDGECLIRNITLAVPQGKLVALHGSHGSGRQTLLSLIGHKIFPTEGHVFIPAHLRILHVTQDIYALDTSVANNLVFGVGPQDIDYGRIKSILEDLQAPELLQQLEHDPLPSVAEDPDSDDSCVEARDCYGVCSHSEQSCEHADGSWQRRLTYTLKAKLHLARALIMNPEVLVLQRPLLHFDPETSDVVLKCLHQHVENRGLRMPSETAKTRRPRTVFLSVESVEQVREPAVLWKLDNGTVTEGAATKSGNAQACPTCGGSRGLVPAEAPQDSGLGSTAPVHSTLLHPWESGWDSYVTHLAPMSPQHAAHVSPWRAAHMSSHRTPHVGQQITGE